MSKVGRNDPCPCGSEKKFKKCCGAQQETGDDKVASALPYSDPAIPSPAQMEIDTEQCKAELIELWKVFYADRNPGGKKKYKGLGLWPMDLYNAVNEFADEVRPWVREKYRYMVWNAMHGTDERAFWLILNLALHESKTCKPAHVRDVFKMIREEKGIVDKHGKVIKTL